MTEICNLKTANKLDLPFTAWRILESEACEIVRFHLNPGEEIEAHANPNNATFFIIRGKAGLQVDSGTFELSKDDCIRIVKNIIRKWQNIGNHVLEVLVFKEI